MSRRGKVPSRLHETISAGKNHPLFAKMTKKTLYIPITHPSQIAVSDRVGFLYKDRQCQGRVCRKGSRYAYVVCDDQREFQVPYPLLRKIPGAMGPISSSLSDRRRLAFQINERVGFKNKDRILEAVILRLNPKRAHVLCDNGDEYRVSYGLLKTCAARPGEDRKNPRGEEKLTTVARRARQLLNQHGLENWGFHFDEATRRAGCCRYGRKTISLSHGFAVAATDGEIDETLLHEIAHALVGPSHHHDIVWRAKAIEIGCSGQRCHEFRFTPPRYIVHCENRCWTATAERRTRGGVCRCCHGQLIYLTYSETRYREEIEKATPKKK
ncbi:MAG: SprT family zinc-dependent metalloprotease [Desulfuromonadaceae bacterium]|nr:SprT family zinc-dependent metalloprotease [Desulfuromonadaceae bacterium]